MTDSRAAGDRVTHPLFSKGGESGSSPTAALLWFCDIDLDRCRSLNRLWHSTLPELGGGGSRVCYGATFDGLYYATACWTNPASPKLPQLTWLQLKRFAIAPDAPRNTASRMMAWMERDVRKRFPDVTEMVSYQDCERHTGGIYRLAGWTPGPVEVRSEATTWHNRQRSRRVNGKPRVVRRWTKELR